MTDNEFTLGDMVQTVAGWTLSIFFLLWMFNFHIGPNLLTNENVNYANSGYCLEFAYGGRWRLYEYGESGFRGHKYTRVRAFPPQILNRVSIAVAQKKFAEPTISDLIEGGENGPLDDSISGPNVGGDIIEITVDGKSAWSRIFSMSSNRRREIYIPRKQDGLIIRMISAKDAFAENNDLFERFLQDFHYDESCDVPD